MAELSAKTPSGSAPTVAIIGAGPSGLSMLKTLRNDGFRATLLERRKQVGGLWAYSDDPDYTSALKKTRAAISKFTCGFTDFPVPDDYPVHLAQPDWQRFMQSYAEHFDLLKDIRLGTDVAKVHRDVNDQTWLVDTVTANGVAETLSFDKVVFTHGYQTKATRISIPGQEDYTGNLIHAQQYKEGESFQGQKVVLVGLGTTASDIACDLVPYASKIYASHRRGVVPGRRMHKGVPADLLVTWRRRVITQWLARSVPRLNKWLIDKLSPVLVKAILGMKLDPAWRLEPFPSISTRLPSFLEEIFPLLIDGRVESLHGIKRFCGGKRVEFSDGTIIDDVDTVIMCTGYRGDFGPAPFVESSMPMAYGYAGEPIRRLYMNMFPPKYADSCAMLCYSAYGKNNGFSFSDVMSMAISNAWRGVSPTILSDRPAMERWIDEHQEWIAGLWAQDANLEPSMVRQWEFQGWLHDTAGTGMENLGWGWKGWQFWWRDRELYNLMNHGAETAHMFRYFDTGKRPVWPGARDEIIHQNRLIKDMFPLK